MPHLPVLSCTLSLDFASFAMQKHGGWSDLPLFALLAYVSGMIARNVIAKMNIKKFMFFFL